MSTYRCPVHGVILDVEKPDGSPSIDMCPVTGCREPLVTEEQLLDASGGPYSLTAEGAVPVCGTCHTELIGPHEGDKWCPHCERTTP
jgi:hypothetical protein